MPSLSIGSLGKSLGAAAAVLTVAACAEMGMETGAEMAEMYPADFPAQGTVCDNSYESGIEVTGTKPGEVTAMRLVAAGATDDAIFGDRAVLERTLNALGAEGKELRSRTGYLRESSMSRGLAKLSLLTFLDALEATNGVGPGTEVEQSGQIRAYWYNVNQDVDSAGKIRKSCMQVEVTNRSRPASGAAWTETRYRVHVFGDFRVADRTPPGPLYNPVDVFPDADTVPIGQQLANNPRDPAHPYMFKLWARSDMLQVTKAEHMAGTGTWVDYPANDPIYDNTPGSCIDMLFVNSPPERLPSTLHPPFYCLGRCKHPPILNTGA